RCAIQRCSSAPAMARNSPSSTLPVIAIEPRAARRGAPSTHLVSGDSAMRENDIRERAFAMPLTSPAYPPGPYRFINREYLIITYRTDPEKLRAQVPAPL